MDNSDPQTIPEDDTFWLEFFIFVSCLVILTLIISLYAWFLTAQIFFMDTLSIITVSITLGLIVVIGYVFYATLFACDKSNSCHPSKNRGNEESTKTSTCVEMKPLIVRNEVEDQSEITEVSDSDHVTLEKKHFARDNIHAQTPMPKDRDDAKRMNPVKNRFYEIDSDTKNNERGIYWRNTNRTSLVERRRSRVDIDAEVRAEEDIESTYREKGIPSRVNLDTDVDLRKRTTDVKGITCLEAHAKEKQDVFFGARKKGHSEPTSTATSVARFPGILNIDERADIKKRMYSNLENSLKVDVETSAEVKHRGFGREKRVVFVKKSQPPTNRGTQTDSTDLS